MTQEPDLDQQALIDDARRLAAALRLSEERVDRIKAERVEMMKDMHAAGVSWALIGKTFGVSRQACLYATGTAQRQTKKGPTQSNAPTDD